MDTNSLAPPIPETGAETGMAFGRYLRERRARLDPAAFGFATGRRRTPGLRREEVAQIAHVSATWYTWLEQGRGGAPSADVLDRLARALRLDETEREYLFLLAQQRPPQVTPRPPAAMPPVVQQVLDAMAVTPALVKQPDWTVEAWNPAAAALFPGLTASAGPGRYNVLEQMFLAPPSPHLLDRDAVARSLVATVRHDLARSGTEAASLERIERLKRQSPEFRRIWQAGDVLGLAGGSKTLDLPGIGLLSLDFSTFAVEGTPGLSMVVFTPRGPADRAALDRLCAQAPG